MSEYEWAMGALYYAVEELLHIREGLPIKEEYDPVIDKRVRKTVNEYLERSKRAYYKGLDDFKLQIKTEMTDAEALARVKTLLERAPRNDTGLDWVDHVAIQRAVDALERETKP